MEMEIVDGSVSALLYNSRLPVVKDVYVPQSV
jgi:serine protease inhibitor ecotin